MADFLGMMSRRRSAIQMPGDAGEEPAKLRSEGTSGAGVVTVRIPRRWSKASDRSVADQAGRTRVPRDLLGCANDAPQGELASRRRCRP